MADPTISRSSPGRRPKIRSVAALALAALAGAGAVALLRSRRGDGEGLPVMSLADSLLLIAEVPLPVIAKGVIIRRKKVVAVAEATGIEKRSLRRMQRLHEKYGPGPVLLGIPGRNQAVLFEPAHVDRVLMQTPRDFATASDLKVSALGHFQPHGSLVSHLPERSDRRSFNEQLLESACPMHSLARQFTSVVRQEAQDLLAREEFGWDHFAQSWFRIVRRIVLGDRARNDVNFHRMITDLRHDANWGFLKPKRQGLRDEFLEQLRGYIAAAEPGSLAALAAAAPDPAQSRPDHQLPQYLFAFDPAGMATMRALALLAVHDDEARRARAEADSAGDPPEQQLARIRAAILESLRLWPTTPLILRRSTRETVWERGIMPAETEIAIYAAFFHRDDRRLPFANRFEPDLWLQDPPAGGWPLVPFSGGPGVCPARHLVLLTGSRFISELLKAREVQLEEPWRLSKTELPAILDPFTLRFRLSSRGPQSADPDGIDPDARVTPDKGALAPKQEPQTT